MGKALPVVFYTAAGSLFSLSMDGAGANRAPALNDAGTAWEWRDTADASRLLRGTIPSARLPQIAYSSLSGLPTLGTAAAHADTDFATPAGVVATVASAIGSLTTTNIPEGNNPYFTTARARAAIAGSGELTYSATTGVIGLSSNIPVMSGGKISAANLPSIAISDTFLVSSQAAMLALTAQTGDIAVRTDLNKSFILAVNDPTILANWQELLTPASPVQSVNGMTGAITLTTSNIAEVTNQYFTNARSRAAISAVTPLSYNSATGVMSIALAAVATSGSASDLNTGTLNAARLPSHVVQTDSSGNIDLSNGIVIAGQVNTSLILGGDLGIALNGETGFLQNDGTNCLSWSADGIRLNTGLLALGNSIYLNDGSASGGGAIGMDGGSIQSIREIDFLQASSLVEDDQGNLLLQSGSGTVSLNGDDLDFAGGTVLNAQIDASQLTGTINLARIPATAISTYLGDISSQAAMLALNGQPGDWCTRSDTTPTETFWILIGTPSTSISSWKELQAPGTVTSVNGLIGSVTLTTSNIAEGSGQYFTNTRAIAALVGNAINPATATFTSGTLSSPTIMLPGSSGTNGIGGTAANAELTLWGAGSRYQFNATQFYPTDGNSVLGRSSNRWGMAYTLGLDATGAVQIATTLAEGALKVVSSAATGYGAGITIDSTAFTGGVKYFLKSGNSSDAGGGYGGKFFLYDGTNGAVCFSATRTAAAFPGTVSVGNAVTFADGIVNKLGSDNAFAHSGGITYCYVGSNGLKFNDQANSKTILQILNSGAITTLNNTIDDNSGNAVFKGYIRINSNSEIGEGPVVVLYAGTDNEGNYNGLSPRITISDGFWLFDDDDGNLYGLQSALVSCSQLNSSYVYLDNFLSIAGRYYSYNSTSQSQIIGSDSNATGGSSYSVAIAGGKALGNNSMAIGINSIAYQQCLAFGNNTVGGFVSTAVGVSSSAGYGFDTAIGSEATTSYQFSTALGKGSRTFRTHSTSLSIDTHGGGAAGHAIDSAAPTATNVMRQLFSIDSTWTTSTDASRATLSKFFAYDYSGAREVIQIGATGSAAILGFFGTSGTAQSTGWAVSNYTAAKTYDASSASLSGLSNLVCSLIAELKTKGLIGG